MDRAHYYATNATDLMGIVRSAKMSYENSGQHSVIHKHREGAECNPECEPYPMMGGK